MSVPFLGKVLPDPAISKAAELVRACSIPSSGRPASAVASVVDGVIGAVGDQS